MPSDQHVHAAVKKPRLLLIGWDSADWKIIRPLLDEGGLGGVRSLLEGGVHGNLATLEPQLSPMLWTSIATGKMAYHHGVHGFTEVDPVSGQVVPVSAASRRCKTIWEMLGEHGLRSHVVSWFATQGERDLNGKMVSNMFGHLRGTKPGQDPSEWPAPMPGTYWPEELAEAMDELRVSPHEIDGEILRPFVPDAAKIDLRKDRRLFNLIVQLAEAYSVQSAATHLMESDPDWDFMAVYFRAIDEISHFFMPYHPPKMKGITDEDFELYRHVVNSTYRAHDMMLEYLIQLAGPDTTVILVSDHGFHSDHLRPDFTPQVPAGITVWHRPQGVFLAKGPGIKATGEPLYGARLLDVTPTILHHFGLPVGQDMEGRVLSEIFDDDRPPRTVPTWEDPDGRRKHRGSLSREDSEALLEQFVALGYIDGLSPDPTEAALGTERENKWNLARAYLYARKYEEALPLLEDCHAGCPERTDYAQLLARVQFNLGLADEADKTLAVALKAFRKPFGAHLLKAQIAQEKGQSAAALEHLSGVLGEAPEHPQVLEILCRACVNLRKWPQAREAGEALLRIDPESYQARVTLARVAHSKGDHRTAADHALQAVELQFGDARGHFLLGRALQNLGRATEAVHAFTNCLQLNPDHPAAGKSLARLHRELGNADQADEVEAKALRIRLERHLAEKQKLSNLREGITARARKRQPARRSPAEAVQEEAAANPITFTIVSGLPRSGTSLMMQMLHAAGLEPMTDGRRAADEDNPEGYHEWEDIKKLRHNPRLIEQAAGKAIKVVSALLPLLPSRHRYRIIFMKRPVGEVVTSQWKMLERNGHRPRSEREHLARTQQTHLDQTLAELRAHPRAEILEIDYPSLVAEPEEQLRALRDFLGDALPHPDRLGAPIKPALHRNRR